MTMSFAENRTLQLWQQFMPARKHIQHKLSEALYSVQLYPANFNFDLHCPFEKWAAVEVSSMDQQPEGMQSLRLPGGWYVTFKYSGPAGQAEPFFRYIFTQWFPASSFIPDFSRPHFEMMGPGYDRNDPLATEDICIPVIKNS